MSQYHQPSVADYFKVIKLKQNDAKSTDFSNNKEVISSKMEVQPQNSEKSDPVEAISSSTIDSQPTSLAQLSKPPPLAVIPAGVPTLDEFELRKRVSNGPPRLTPIKNGAPVPSSPVRESRMAAHPYGGGGINSSPVKLSSHPNSPFKGQSSKFCSSPVKYSEISGSPVKPAPSFAGKSVVKRLFCLGDEDEQPNDLMINAQARGQQLPAYQKYAHLATKEPEVTGSEPEVTGPLTTDLYSCSLPLPYKYNILQEVFRAMETVSSIFFNRQEPITFYKLKIKVGDLLRSPILQTRHISQILRVLPNLYDLTWVKGEIVLRPILDISDAGPLYMDHEVIMSRRKKFQQNLIGICYEYHRVFLASLIPPIGIPTGKSLTRWHPKFDLNSVPEITGIELPQNPNVVMPTLSSSEKANNSPGKSLNSTHVEIMKAKRTLMSLRNSKLNPGLSNVQNRTISKDKSISAVQTISKALLERIRAREQLKAIRSMTLTPEETRDRELLTRIPNYVRMVRNAVLIERKGVIPLNLLTQRLINSQSHLCKESEVEEHLRLIEKIVPDWLKILKGTSGSYVKIDKDVEINGIVEQVEILIRKSGESCLVK